MFKRYLGHRLGEHGAALATGFNTPFIVPTLHGGACAGQPYIVAQLPGAGAPSTHPVTESVGGM
jgi:hypothetical protein